MDFTQDYCHTMKYNSFVDLLLATFKPRHGSLVTVQNGRLNIVQAPGTVLVDAATTDVQIKKPSGAMPTAARFNAGGQGWMIDFGRVQRNVQARQPGLTNQLAAGSLLTSGSALSVGKQLAAAFVNSLQSQGATAGF